MIINTEPLVTAIVEQAVKDYRLANNRLGKICRMVADAEVKTQDEIHKLEASAHECRKMISECEIFFRSVWFTTLTDLDGTLVLNQLRKEAV